MSVEQVMLENIEDAFPQKQQAEALRLLAHISDCNDCAMLLNELDGCLQSEINRRSLALLVSSMRHLNLKGLEWLLAKFLYSVVSSNEPANRMEIDYLISFVQSSNALASQSRALLVQMTNAQLRVLIDFLQWLKLSEFWMDYSGREIDESIDILVGILNSQRF